MIKNIVGGILIGGANIIPGVSGGTIIVMLGIFDKTMSSISNLFKIKISWKKQEMKDSKISIISFIAGILLIGALVFFSQGTG